MSNNNSSPLSPLIDCQYIDRNRALEENIQTSNDNVHKSRKVVIITNPVKEGENPLALPSWNEVPTQPLDPEELKTWHKDNAVRKFWTSKFPFLSEHYDQVKLSSKELIQETSLIQKTDNSIDEYEEYEGITSLFEEAKPKRIKTNSDLLDQEEETGLSDLFNE